MGVEVGAVGARLLRCEISILARTAWGQIRPWRHVRVESVLPPTSDIGRRRRHGSSVPDDITPFVRSA